MTPETNTTTPQNQNPQHQELGAKPDIAIVDSLAEQIALADGADSELTEALTQELQHRILLAASEINERQALTFDKSALEEIDEAGLAIQGGIVPDGVKHLHDSLVSNLKRKLGVTRGHTLPTEDQDLIESIFSLEGFVLDNDRLDQDQNALTTRLEQEHTRPDEAPEDSGFLGGSDAEFEEKLNRLVDSPGAPAAFGNIIGTYAEEITSPSIASTKIADEREKQVRANRFYRVVQEAKNRFVPPNIPEKRANESDEDYRTRHNNVVDIYSDYPEFLGALRTSIHTAREQRISRQTNAFVGVQRIERMRSELKLKKRREGERDPRVTDQELIDYSAERLFSDEENAEFRHLARVEALSRIPSVHEHNVDQFVFNALGFRPVELRPIEGPKPHPDIEVTSDVKRFAKIRSAISERLKTESGSALSAITNVLFNSAVKRSPNARWNNRVRATELDFNIYPQELVEAEMDRLGFRDQGHRDEIEAERITHNTHQYNQLSSHLATIQEEIDLATERCIEAGKGLSNEEVEALLWDDKPADYTYTKDSWDARSDMQHFLLDNTRKNVAIDEFIKRHQRVESSGGVEHNRRMKRLAEPLADFVIATTLQQEITRILDNA